MGNPKLRQILAFAAIAGLACDNDPSVGVEGTYPITLTYTEDTCAGDVGRNEAVDLTIEREGDNVTFTVGGAVLTGTFNPEDRVMTVEGTIQVPIPEPGSGSFPGQMRMVARVTEGEVNVLGSITFEGTFPGVSGTCRRSFEASGDRENLSVFPLTGS